MPLYLWVFTRNIPEFSKTRNTHPRSKTANVSVTIESHYKWWISIYAGEKACFRSNLYLQATYDTD